MARINPEKIESAFTSAQAVVQDGVQSQGELRRLANFVSLMDLGPETDLTVAFLRGLGVNLPQVSEHITLLKQPMKSEDAAKYAVNNQALRDMMDTAGNCSGKDGYFSNQDLAAALNKATNPIDYECIRSLQTSYSVLDEIAKTDPNNPYKLPNLRALRVLAGIEPREPKPDPNTMQGAAKIVMNNPSMARLIDTEANLSGRDGLIGQADIAAAINSERFSGDELTALQFLHSNYEQLKRESLANAPNIYQLPSLDGIKLIASPVPPNPNTVQGAAKIIMKNSAMQNIVDTGGNLSGPDRLIGREDIAAAINSGKFTGDELTALQFFHNNYEQMKRQSLAKAPNPYQLPSLDGLGLIANG